MGVRERILALAFGFDRRRDPAGGPRATGLRLAALMKRRWIAVLVDTPHSARRQCGPDAAVAVNSHGSKLLWPTTKSRARTPGSTLGSDFALLDQARQEAFEISARDPALAQTEHKRMIPAFQKMFGDKVALIDAA